MSQSSNDARFVMVRRSVIETQLFLLKVHPQASNDAIVEACTETDALHGDPHDSWSNQAAIVIAPAKSSDVATYGSYIDLVDETTPKNACSM